MGFLSLFGLGEKPRTPAQIVPHVDLARGIVCELGREDNRTTIERRLGVPTKRDANGVRYAQVGLLFRVTKTGTITGWSIFFSPEILVHWRWKELGSRPPSEADVVKLLGAPTKRETDDEEVMLTWERGNVTIMVDYALDGALNDVMVDFE
ncbi:MAG: hypothetical protein ACKV2T_23635 [Kofleriaceae bacterium]